MIAVDWGTTNCRAYLLDGGGKVLDRVGGRGGILNVTDGDFASAFAGLVGAWLESESGLPSVTLRMPPLAATRSSTFPPPSSR